MAFCDKEKQLIDNGYTCLDNKFILNYLPSAPDKCVAVYLLGLALSSSDGADNSCQTIAQKLQMSCQDVLDAFVYWEEMGLVYLSHDQPQRVTYLEITNNVSALKAIDVKKYAKFSKQLQAIITGRMINTSEYNQYYLFLEKSTFEPEALLAVAKYSVEVMGEKISYQYVLAVARNLSKLGATTLQTVNERLNNHQKHDDDLKVLFKTLKLSRKFEYHDRECYDKWTSQFGFTLDVINAVAKKVCRGGIDGLDKLLCQYYKCGAMSLVEIDSYEQTREQTYALAKEINKAIGVYYQSLDMIVDEYVTAWLRKGYEGSTLQAIAKYCFRSGIRTLNGMATVIDKLYKNGITTLEGLYQYLDQLAFKDEQIKQVLTKCGLDRNVNANDRLLYKTWTETWGLNADLILFGAQNSVGTNAPLAYLNRILSDYKQNGVATVQQASQYKTTAQQSTATTAMVNKTPFANHQYTDEELNVLFTSLDETEI